MKTVLITGGAGFIGSHLAGRLVLDTQVVVADSFDDYYDPRFKEMNIGGLLTNRNFKLYRQDINQYSKMKTVFQQHRIDTVYHLAARAGVRSSLKKPLPYVETNVSGTINLLELARENGVKQFIFGSSSSVYGDSSTVPYREDAPAVTPISPYAATKRSAELFCYNFHKHSKLPITCLRFFTVYGPRQRPDMAIFKFIRAAFQGDGIEVYGDGSSERDYTYVDDIVDGVIAAGDKDLGFQIVNLGESRTVTLSRLLEVIETQTGKKLNKKVLPMQPGDMKVTHADISRARELLGFNPGVSIEEGVKRMVAWYKQWPGKG